MKRRRQKITIENRSAWSTAAIRVLATWIVKRAGITWDYSILIRSCRNDSWHGHGWRSSQEVKLDRHYRRGRCRASGWTHLRGAQLWPMKHRDHRFAWSPEYEYRSRLEVLIMLIAHEAYHATGGHPKHFTAERTGQKRFDHDSMEFGCNEFAKTTIEAFRAEWRSVLRPRIVAAMRRERQAVANEKAKAAAKRSDPAPKLEQARMMFATWQRKAKFAATKMKKYRTRIRYYEGRVAAKNGGKGS